MVRAMKDVAEAMTGLDLGDDEGIDTPDDLFARLQQELQAKTAAKEAEHDDTQAAGPRRKKASSAAKPRRNRPPNPCATSSASSPAPCTPTAKPMLSSAKSKRR